MSEAVLVQNAYKKFGSSNLAQWKRLSAHSGSRFYGQVEEVVAVDHVSFSVKQGEIFGLVGPSGSGKSTLIRMLAALLLPDSGDVRIFGYNVARYPTQVQRMVNRVSVEASFFRKLSPVDNLLNGARQYGLSGLETRQQVIEILIRLGLEEGDLHQPMEALSRITQQVVAIARALLCRPRLLLLDEPTAGLSPNAKYAVREMLRELRDRHGITILLAARELSEIEALCDRVAFIEAGKILAPAAPTHLSHPSLSDASEPALENVFLDLAVNQVSREFEVT